MLDKLESFTAICEEVLELLSLISLPRVLAYSNKNGLASINEAHERIASKWQDFKDQAKQLRSVVDGVKREIADATARAEKAEARVKELEAITVDIGGIGGTNDHYDAIRAVQIIADLQARHAMVVNVVLANANHVRDLQASITRLSEELQPEKG